MKGVKRGSMFGGRSPAIRQVYTRSRSLRKRRERNGKTNSTALRDVLPDYAVGDGRPPWTSRWTGVVDKLAHRPARPRQGQQPPAADDSRRENCAAIATARL